MDDRIKSLESEIAEASRKLTALSAALVVASIQRASGGSGKLSYYQKNPDDTWSFVSSFSADDNQMELYQKI